MTREQRLQWVVLPAGAAPAGAGPDPAADGLSVSLFVAPRLRTDEGLTLASFPDFLDWPARVRAGAPAVTVGGTEVEAVVVSPQPDSTLWTALFDADTPLAPFEFDDLADRPLVTYSVAEVLGALRRAYATTAAAALDGLPSILGTEHVEPEVVGLRRTLGEVVPVLGGQLFEGVQNAADRQRRVASLLTAARGEAALRRAPGAARGGPVVEPLAADGSPSRQIERALLFHSRAEPLPTAMPADGDHYVQRVDFHQMLSALGDHPALLRRLGLVVDLWVARADVPETTNAAPGELGALPGIAYDGASGAVEVLPRTAYVLQRTDPGGPAEALTFAAAVRHPSPLLAPDSPPTAMMDLPPATFALEQVDVDGAVLKLVNLAATVARAAVAPGADGPALHQPDQAGLPALRTSGLSLVHGGRAQAVQDDFTATLVLNDAAEVAAPAILYAEDLLRGLRVDVLDTSGTAWRSLHRRTVRASATRFGEIEPVEDEGFFQLSLAGAPTAPDAAPDPDGELYVHETLVTWDGWSLSVPRPGASLSRDPRAPDPDVPQTQPVRVPNEPFTAMGLQLDTGIVPGTLPRLRFGRSYRVRVRCVDLAGNGPGIAEADAALASAVTDVPALPAAGGAAYRRFEPVPAPVLVPTEAYSEGASLHRLVVRSNAGQTSQDYATAFDASDTVTVEGHAPYAAEDARHVAAPKAAFELLERHGRFDSVIGTDGTPPDAAAQAAIQEAYELARREKGSIDDPSVPGTEVVVVRDEPASGDQPARHEQYVVHHEDQLVLPYLPDPLSSGAVFFGLPGQLSASPFTVRFDGATWHDAQPLRLRLTDGDGPPEWDPAARVLTVRLPQASSASVRVASLLDADLDLMGILDWCEHELDGPAFEPILAAAKENRSWLVTPWSDVALTHAVQQPLEPPGVEVLTVSRGGGQTSVDLFGVVKVHVPSTEKVDLVASWSETVDDPALPVFEVRAGSAVVFSLPLSLAATGRTDGDPHEFPYSVREGRLLTFWTAAARNAGLTRPAAHAFGDTKYRQVTYTLLATTPYREYFPPQWNGHPELLSRSSEPVVLDVLSSAPPLVPQVLYVVPTQGLEVPDPPDVDGTAVQRRRGGGLRVYLGRSWFSSGDGELLGVVIGDSVSSPQADDYPFLTLIGQDPARGGSGVAFPVPETFPGAVIAAGITLQERAGTVRIAGYAPAYDEPTGRWFADIDVATEQSYLPFVRLALVRYQPHSLSGCEVSPVVLSDIVQTLPDRTLTVTVDPGDAASRRVTVTGPAYTSVVSVGAPRSDPAALASMTARVEQRDPVVGDDLLAWSAIEGSEVALAVAWDGTTATWSGSLPLPESPAGWARRVLVLEQDRLPVDGDTPGQDGFAQRVVYAAVVDV